MGEINAILRLNMSGRVADGRAEADRYGAALDMAAYADQSGFDIINVEEHHDAEIGWLPSPLVMAALIIGRTTRVRVRASALLAPLYDPIRLAEDVSILDPASRGRFVFVLGRYGLPYFPAQPSPGLEALYLAELTRLGKQGYIERHEDLSLLIIDEDPEQAWPALGPYLLREAGEYARWSRSGVERRYESAVSSDQPASFSTGATALRSREARG